MIELAIYIVLTILLYPVTVFPYSLILLLFQNIPPIYKKRGVLSCTAVEKVLATSSETVQATPTLKYFVQTKF